MGLKSKAKSIGHKAWLKRGYLIHKGRKLHGKYKKYKAGETKRLQQKLAKERLKSKIRMYKHRYKPKSQWGSVFKELKSFTGSHKRRTHRRHRRRHSW